ncbi:MAG: DUF4349 domain-containing protein [Bacteroidales bacterium]|nr:DUF4349 domain-containing protein [Bacteroidales bacterium]
MKYSITAITLLALFMVLSCHSNPVNFEGGNPEGMAKMEMRTPAPAGATDAYKSQEESMAEQPELSRAITYDRKIIRDANLLLIVKDIVKSKTAVDSLVKKHKAYYSNETYNNTDYEHNCYVGIRVPAENLDALIAEIEKEIGEVYNKNINARDVTEEYIDLDTRLKNKRNYLNRYTELLKQAKTIKDILEIQTKIRELEEEIESTTGRLKYLTNQVNFSTLNLQLTKRTEIYLDPDKGKFGERLKNSLVKGWYGLVNFILFVIRIWPFWIIAGGILYVIRRFLIRRRERKK